MNTVQKWLDGLKKPDGLHSYLIISNRSIHWNTGDPLIDLDGKFTPFELRALADHIDPRQPTEPDSSGA